MTLLPDNAKEPLKTSLGIAIAYAASMSMGWENPMWAGFTVAFISLATVGHSFRRSILRMLGTLMGGAVALTLLALFAQQRWFLMAALTVYIGFCTYRMLGSRNPYFYFVAAFVSVIILFTGGIESMSAFDTAVARAQETALGILVYTLIAVFLWPRDTKAMLDSSSRDLIAVQRQLFGAGRGLMMGDALSNSGGDAGRDELRSLQLQQAQLAAGLKQALDGAEADSYVVWRSRHGWQRLQQLTAALGEALERWHTSLVQTQAQADALDMEQAFPNVGAFLADLDGRFVQIGQLLGTETPIDETAQTPAHRVLETSNGDDGMRAPFQTAALADIHAQLERIEQLSRELFDCAAALKAPAARPLSTDPKPSTTPAWSLDPDRLGAAVRVAAGLWIGILTWIYVNPPASGLFIIFIVAVGMMLVQTPWVPVWKLFVPLLVAAILGGVTYILVMPHLTSYAGLGTMILVVTFAIGFLFSAPRLAVLRGIGLAMFLYFIAVDNQQVYSFPTYANQAAVLFLATLVLVIAANIPTSSRPEKVFTRLIRRYFRHAELLTARLSTDWKREMGWFGRAELAFYGNDLLAIPRKLAIWGAQIDHQAFPDTSPERVQALVNSLTILAHRSKALVEARRPAQADFLAQELLPDVRDWRLAMQRVLSDCSDDPAAASDADRQRLTTQVENMDARIRATLEHPEKPLLSDQDYQRFYRLIGAFRSMNDAVIAHQHLAAQVDWAPWRRARF